MPHYDEFTLLRVARAYYLEGMTQAEIARAEGLHRTQVSRMLKSAREQGYIQIRIRSPKTGDSASLADRLKIALKLDHVEIASETSSGQADQALYFSAARYLEKALAKSRRIGIGLGKTLYRTALELGPQLREDQPAFYSAAGWSGTNNPYLQGNVILDTFARAFGGSSYYNNFPVCLDERQMSDLDQERFQALQSAYQSLDTVVLSIGGPFSRDYPYLEEFSLMEEGVQLDEALARPHGNLLGHIIFEEGVLLKVPPPYLITSIPLALLSQLDQVICLAHGSQKIGSIISAARLGFFKTLVTDLATARQILDRLAA